MSLRGGAPSQRRRGETLETALLDAAWSELVERGYDELTIDAVATRAETSRAVLYRRWPGKKDLVLAALVHQAKTEAVDIPDTGSLRGDIVALMHEVNKVRPRLVAQLLTRLGGFYTDANTNLAELSSYVLGGRDAIVDQVIARAVARGEIEAGQVSGRVARVPFDLFRLELVMTMQPVPQEVIEEIIDDVFLPLVRLGATTTSSSHRHVDSASEL